MRLLHNDRLIGTVTDLSEEGVWMNGTLRLASDLPSVYRDFFAFMTNESRGDEDPPFDDDLLDDETWFVADDDGTKRGIDIPAVHDGDFVTWRWR
jgi:hypothetical protein